MGNGWAQLTGIMGLVVVLAQMLKRHAARVELRRAAAELEALGTELGLEYVEPTYPNGQGSLRGVYRGRPVSIDPDQAQAIIVRFAHSPRILLATQPVEAALAHDMVLLSSVDEGFDAFWRTRRAAPELAQMLSESARSDWLAAFRGAIARQIGSVRVSSDSVTVVVDSGRPGIPAPVVRALLPACADLAQHIEPDPSEAAAPERAEARPRPEPQVPRHFAYLLLLIAAVLFIGKLALARWMDGKADAAALQQLAAWARYAGSDVYTAQPAFGLPPPMVFVLGMLDRLVAATGLTLGFWSSVLASCAEAGMLLVCYRMLRPSLASPAARCSLLLVAALPAALALGGCRGSWHSVTAFLVLLSIYWTARRPDWLAGGALGLGLCVSLAPVYAVPALLIARTPRARLVFGAGTLLVLGVAWLPWLSSDPAAVWQRLLQRDGGYGQWGMSWLLTQAVGPHDILHAAYQSAAPYLPLLVALVLALGARRSLEPPTLLAQVSVSACVALLALPSLQLWDLRLLVPVLACVAPLGAAFFALSSATLTVVACAHWAATGAWSMRGATPVGGEYLQAVCLFSLLLSIHGAWRSPRAASELGAQRSPPPLGGWYAWGAAAALLLVLPAALQIRAESATPAPAAPEALAEARAHDYVGVSTWLLQRGMNTAGIAAAREATRLQPGNAVAWNNLAAGHANERRWDAAIAAAKRAVALDPSFQLASNNLAWARARKREAMQSRAALPVPRG